MTDRVRTLTVHLNEDTRIDDVEFIVNAIQMVKGVSTVELGKPVDMTDWSARMAVGSEFQREILDALDRVRKGKT